jgi:hypothetical protein
MNRAGVILWDLILVFFSYHIRISMWLLCLPHLRYWRGVGEGRPVARMRCLFPKYGCSILAALNLIILYVEMLKFGNY